MGSGPMVCHALNTLSLTNLESPMDLFLPKGKHLFLAQDFQFILYDVGLI